MISSLNNLLTKRNSLLLGNKFFLLGVFFLPSALPISAIFLLAALTISYKKNQVESFKELLNFPFLISIGFIILSSINITFINKPEILSEYDISKVWINLFNWLPIFFYYLGFQTYLKTTNQKFIFAKYLVSGTFPVILSFILQKFFNLYGPFKTLFGLIVWFQKPVSNLGVGPFSGLFNNPNYGAIWLVLVLPFTLILFKKIKYSVVNKSIVLIFSLLLIYTILLTGSRNGILGIFITIICLYGIRKFILISTILFSLFSGIKFFSILTNIEIIIFKIFDPNFLINKVAEINIYNFPRIDIWNSTLERIIERPLLGWGASTFPFLHLANNPAFIVPKKIIDAQHSHNLILELCHNFGIPMTLIIITMIMILLIKSYVYIFLKYERNKDYTIHKAWFTSGLIVTLAHLSDITLYDGKISILIGILFAGLKGIINEYKIKDF